MTNQIKSHKCSSQSDFICMFQRLRSQRPLGTHKVISFQIRCLLKIFFRHQMRLVVFFLFAVYQKYLLCGVFCFVFGDFSCVGGGTLPLNSYKNFQNICKATFRFSGQRDPLVQTNKHTHTHTQANRETSCYFYVNLNAIPLWRIGPVHFKRTQDFRESQQ